VIINKNKNKKTKTKEITKGMAKEVHST